MNKSITLQIFLKIMMIVFINIFLFIGELIISYKPLKVNRIL